MSINSVAIFGGTGQTGSAIATALRRLGIGAAQLSRDDLTEDATAAWQDADAAYLIAPNMHDDEPRLIQSHLDLLMHLGISRVVYHSVAAPYSPSMKHHVGKAVSEDLVRRSGLAWTIVQPCAYIQNFVPDPADSEIRVPFDVNARFGMVDLCDVGEAATTIMSSEEHVGATYELGGPEQLSIREAAVVATETLGHPVTAVAESPQAWLARTAGQMPRGAADMFFDMWRYYDQYGLPTGGVTLGALLGRPATSFSQVLGRAL